MSAARNARVDRVVLGAAITLSDGSKRDILRVLEDAASCIKAFDKLQSRVSKDWTTGNVFGWDKTFRYDARLNGRIYDGQTVRGSNRG